MEMIKIPVYKPLYMHIIGLIGVTETDTRHFVAKSVSVSLIDFSCDVIVLK